MATFKLAVSSGQDEILPFTPKNSAPKICRLCSAQTISCHSLLDSRAGVMLEALSSVKVTSDNPFTVVCTKCFLNLKLAFRIQQGILKAEKRLLQVDIHVKTEAIAKKAKEVDDWPRVSSNDTCIICGETTSLELLNSHVEAHFRAPHYCDFCLVNFRAFEEYKSHLSQCQGGQSCFVCHYCGHTFRYKSLYNLHIEKLHSSGSEGDAEEFEVAPLQEAEVAIARLELTTKKARDLLWISNDGSVKKVKKCPVCGRLISSTNFTQHVNKHDGVPQVCEVCGASLKNDESLRQHVFYTHNDLRYACGHCGKKYRKKFVRDIHERKVHTGTATHTCDTCGKSFFSTPNLNKHVRMTHLKLRNHKCAHCLKSFSSRYALKTHLRQHTNETPYVCDICYEGFRQKVSLRTHKRSKHGIVEPVVCSCKVCHKGFASETALQSHRRIH